VIFRKLIPQDERFFALLQQHGEWLGEASSLLGEVVADPAGTTDRIARIREVEGEADAVVRKLVELINTTFVTPLDREDLHALATSMDDVVDHVDATAQRLALYRCRESPPALAEMAACLGRQADAIGQALQGLPQLRQGPRKLLDRCADINRLEAEGDRALHAGLEELFAPEEPDPLHVLKWKDVYESLEMALDAAEDVADVLEGIALKYA